MAPLTLSGHIAYPSHLQGFQSYHNYCAVKQGFDIGVKYVSTHPGLG